MKKLLLFLIVLAAFLVLTPISNAELVKKPDGAHVMVNIKRGWNLIPLYTAFWLDNTFGVSGWPNSNVVVVYALDPITKSYKTITDLTDSNKLFDRESGIFGEYNDENKNTLENAHNLLTNVLISGMWVYSKGEFTIDRHTNLPDYFGEIVKAYGGIQLYQGWNFFSVTPDVGVGRSLDDIKGNCNINKTAVWDKLNQSWRSLELSQVFLQSEDVGEVLALKVNESCKLSNPGSSGGIGVPPPIPN